MADSHDNLDRIRSAVSEFKKRKCSLVIHAGDFVAPFAARELASLNCPVKAVFGNCDGEKAGLRDAIARFGVIRKPPYGFRFQDRRILILHAPENLETHIEQQKVNIIITAHTHEPKAEVKNGVLVINPGETGGWLSGRGTVALIDPERLSWQFLDV